MEQILIERLTTCGISVAISLGAVWLFVAVICVVTEEQ